MNHVRLVMMFMTRSNSISDFIAFVYIFIYKY